MNQNKFTEEELKITAILYANKPSVVEYLKKKGTLPKRIEPGGFHIGMNVIIRTRGRNPVLREKEQLVYEAILREGRLPGGVVRLLPENCADGTEGNEKNKSSD